MSFYFSAADFDSKRFVTFEGNKLLYTVKQESCMFKKPASGAADLTDVVCFMSKYNFFRCAYSKDERTNKDDKTKVRVWKTEAMSEKIPPVGHVGADNFTIYSIIPIADIRSKDNPKLNPTDNSATPEIATLIMQTAKVVMEKHKNLMTPATEDIDAGPVQSLPPAKPRSCLLITLGSVALTLGFAALTCLFFTVFPSIRPSCINRVGDLFLSAMEPIRTRLGFQQV